MVVGYEKDWGEKVVITGDCMGEEDAILITLSGGGIARLGKSSRPNTMAPISLKVRTCVSVCVCVFPLPSSFSICLLLTTFPIYNIMQGLWRWFDYVH
jgi:hypothetical protein